MSMNESVRTTGRRSLAATVIVALVAALLGVAGVVGIPSPAFAATGDYTVDLSGPATVDVWESFTYTVSVNAEVTAEDPAEGVVLTLMLDPHLDVDSVATGGSSPAESYDYDEATGELVVTLRTLTDVNSAFSISVTQKNVVELDPTSTFTTSVTGTQTPSGATPSDAHVTDVTGAVAFRTDKRMSIEPGTGNRVVVYRFPIIGHNSGTPGYFSSAAQRLVDELAPGIEVIGSNADAGEWTFTGDSSTGITATYEHSGTFLVGAFDDDVWLRVRYPADAFPEATQPPRNTVSLSVEDQAGTWYENIHEAGAQPAEVNSGAPVPMAALEKTMPAAANNGQRVDTDLAAFYTDGGQGLDAESIVLEDVASHAQNETYFEAMAVRELRFNSNTVLQSADLPIRLEVQFDDGSWQVADDTRMTGQGQYRVGFVADGSTIGVGGTHASVGFPAGAVLTGWRLTVSPDAATTVPTGSRFTVLVRGYATYTGDPGGSMDLSNEASVTMPVEDGTEVTDVAADTLTLNDAVAVSTAITAPSTLVVNEPAAYQVCAVNRDQTRSYEQFVMNVVLPQGVEYDAATGVSPAGGGVNSVPPVAVGDDLTVDQTALADGRQLVTFTFDEVPPHLSYRQEQHGGTTAWCYTVPVNVLLASYVEAANSAIEAESWVHVNDPALDGVRYDNPAGSATLTDDVHDFDAAADRIVFASDTSTVITGGGMSVEKTASADGTVWGTEQIAAEDGTALWRIQMVNTLPDEVSGVTVFDFLPVDGDSRGSDLTTTLAGPVTGPTGVTIEYSADATSAENGSWSTSWEDATSWRATVAVAAVGEVSEFVLPVVLEDGLATEQAVNEAAVAYTYIGQPGDAATNRATLSPYPLPDISAQKTVDPESGTSVMADQEVTYTLTFENAGNATGDVEYVDDLSGVLDDAALISGAQVSDPALAAAIEGDALRVSGALDAGQNVTVNYTVRVHADFARGDNLLENMLAPASVEMPECDAESVICTSNPIPELGVSKTVDPASGEMVDVGDTLTYTLTFANSGQGIAAVDFVDHLADVLDDAQLAAEISVDAGLTAERDADHLHITGSLAAGEAATVVYSVTVTEQGNRTLENFLTIADTEPATECTDEVSLCTSNPVRAPQPSAAGGETSLPITGGTFSAVTTTAATLALLLGIGLVVISRRRRPTEQNS